MSRAVRFLVSGRVQGVFYRAAAAGEAQSLGLAGWVRNLDDGRVELVARGEPAAIERIAAWLWQGPPRAEVSAVEIEEFPAAPDAGFAIER